jgi:hypothetical protein
MSYTRSALCGVLLLATVIGVAQTVVRIAPPPPSGEGWLESHPDQGTSGLADTSGGMALGTCGLLADGCARHGQESFGWRRVGCEAEAVGYFTKDTGASLADPHKG